MLASVIRDVHCGHRGRSIGVSRDVGENWDFDITLPCTGGSVTELSVTDGCQWRGGDQTNVPQCKSCLLVNIAHLAKFHVFGRSKIKTRHKGSPPAGKKRSKQSGSTMTVSIFAGFGDAVSVNAAVGRDIGHSDLISENGYWVSFGVGYLSPGMRS
jgi:hypothetical protein